MLILAHEANSAASQNFTFFHILAHFVATSVIFRLIAYFPAKLGSFLCIYNNSIQIWVSIFQKNKIYYKWSEEIIQISYNVTIIIFNDLSHKLNMGMGWDSDGFG